MGLPGVITQNIFIGVVSPHLKLDPKRQNFRADDGLRLSRTVRWDVVSDRWTIHCIVKNELHFQRNISKDTVDLTRNSWGDASEGTEETTTEVYSKYKKNHAFWCFWHINKILVHVSVRHHSCLTLPLTDYTSKDPLSKIKCHPGPGCDWAQSPTINKIEIVPLPYDISSMKRNRTTKGLDGKIPNCKATFPTNKESGPSFVVPELYITHCQPWQISSYLNQQQ